MSRVVSCEDVFRDHIKQVTCAVSASVNVSSTHRHDHTCVCALSVVASVLYLYSFHNDDIDEMLTNFSQNEALLMAECCVDVLIAPQHKQYSSDDIFGQVQYLQSYVDILRRIVIFFCQRFCGESFVSVTDVEAIRWKWIAIHLAHFLNPTYNGTLQ